MKTKTLRFAVVASAAIVLITPSATAQQILHGHVPQAVARLHLRPIGRLPETNRLNLTIGLPLRNREMLTNLLQQLYDPASANYHHYLTPQQFTERFGPTEQDYQTVVNFAKTNGLEVVATHDSRMLLDVRGKVSDIEAAFHVTLQTYQHPTESRKFYAPDVDPSVDSNLPIQEINGISDYAILRPMGHAEQIAKNSGTAAGSSPNGGYYMGKDFRNAYAPGVSLNGAGQIIGLFEADGYYTSDITNYEAKAGLTNVPLQNILVDGFSGTPGGNNYEVALDIELAISMAPGLAGVVVYESPNNTLDWLDILDDMATNTQIKQFSSSWGYTGGENPNVQFDQAFVKMAMQGQSFIQASGDGDAWTNAIWVPADSPYVTSVGGTTLTMIGSGVSYVSETVWNSGYYNSAGLSGPWFANGNGYWGSGGGISGSYSIPYWQQGVNMVTNHGSTVYRNIPDVAIVANGIYAIYNNGSSDWFVGTSCAAPLWAGFIALVNQQATNYYQPSVGFINPAIYNIGNGASYTSCFHDITTGTNTWPGSPTNYYAIPGYDLCTGWGTPNGANLIYALTSTGTQHLVWRGDGLANTWNTTNAYWFNGTNLVAFQSGDTVTFDDTGSNNPAINLTGLLVPAMMTVNAAQNYTFSGGGYFVGGMALTKSGTGTLTLNNTGSNTYSGGTTVSAGVLQLGDGLTSNGSVAGNITNNGVLFFANPFAETFSGNISGAGALGKTGAGTLTLSAANNYSGGTTISNGTLLVNNTGGSATGSGAVTIANGGALGGTGIISGVVLVNSGGALTPGNPLGTLTISNNLPLAAGSTTFMQIRHSPLTNNAVKVTGTLTEGGMLVVTNIGATALAAGDSFKLFNAANYSGAFANVVLPSLPAGLAWNTNNLNTSGALSVVIAAKPVIGSVMISGNSLVFNGAGGVGGANFYLLGATNLASPLTNWTLLLTNQFDGGGNFNFTNPFGTNAQSFYRLQLQ